jgi:hypothetical protein
MEDKKQNNISNGGTGDSGDPVNIRLTKIEKDIEYLKADVHDIKIEAKTHFR